MVGCSAIAMDMCNWHSEESVFVITSHSKDEEKFEGSTI